MTEKEVAIKEFLCETIEMILNMFGVYLFVSGIFFPIYLTLKYYPIGLFIHGTIWTFMVILWSYHSKVRTEVNIYDSYGR